MKYFLSVVLVFLALAHLQQKGFLFKDFETIPTKQAHFIIEKNSSEVIVVDVRTPKEIAKDGYISGSIFIPLQQITKDISELEKYKDKTILIYSRSGRRSIVATRELEKKGYRAVSIEGGIREWINLGFEVKK